MTRIVLAGLLLLLLQACSTTVLTASCTRPQISNNNIPYVYLVMLPYVSQPASDDPQQKVALSTLNSAAALEALAMAAESSSMHLTLLEAVDGKCDSTKVYQEIVRERLSFRRKLIASAVFFWGEVFEQGGELVVQSHVRVFWEKEHHRTVQVRRGEQQATVIYGAHLPYSTISFPPRQVPLAQGSSVSIASLFSALEGYAAPDLAAPRKAIPRRFTIDEKRGKWVLLTSPEGSDSVWVPAASSGTAARTVLPELSFAHALAAFINARSAPHPGDVEEIRRWLGTFRQGYPDSQNPLLRRPLAMADIIEAGLELQPIGSPGDVGRARELLLQAATALPESSTVLNLAAVASMTNCCATIEAAARVQDLLERARALDPADKTVAINLMQWYREMDVYHLAFPPEKRLQFRARANELARILAD